MIDLEKLEFYKMVDGFSSIEEQGELFKKLIPLQIGEKRRKDPLRIAEIGVYKGRMTSMICEMLEMAGINARYYCVDHFKGSQEHARRDYTPEFMKTHHMIADMINVKIILKAYESMRAAEEFKDGFFDIVYLDASHDYDSVLADIDAWRGKVKKGGVLCGDDYIEGWPGVIKAVNKRFGGEFQRIGKQQWFVIL